LAGIQLFDTLKDIVPFLTVSLMVLAVTYVSTSTISNMALLLVVRILMAVILYTSTMKLLKVKVMDECINFIRQRM
jgi:hypothetical protein